MQNTNPVDADRVTDTKWHNGNFTAMVQLRFIKIRHQQTCKVENTI